MRDARGRGGAGWPLPPVIPRGGAETCARGAATLAAVREARNQAQRSVRRTIKKVLTSWMERRNPRCERLDPESRAAPPLFLCASAWNPRRNDDNSRMRVRASGMVYGALFPLEVPAALLASSYARGTAACA